MDGALILDPQTRAALRALADGSVEAHRSSGDLVAECLRFLIFDGVLRGGDRVPQDELAEVLGVSRIPVRDALIALEVAGWVVIEPRRGAYVLGLDADAIRDHFELFGQIWALLLRRASGNATEEALAHLAIAERRLANAGDAATMLGANQGFIDQLHRLADAPRLSATFRSASRLVPGNFFEVVPGSIPAQVAHVGRMMKALRRNEADIAGAHAIKLHAVHASNVLDLLSARGVIERDSPRRAARRSRAQHS